MMKKVLITGASGFVGYHLVNKALDHGLEVYAAVRSTSKVSHLQGLPVKFITIDLEDKVQLAAQLREYDFNYIIHAAALTKAKSQEQYDYVNATLSKNLAEAAMGLPSLEKFVFFSSLAAIGPLGSCDTEELLMPDSLPSPVTSYGRSKVVAEEALRSVAGLPLVILRPTAVYGPREKDIFILIRSFSRGLEPYIGKLPQRLSFIYVEDLAEIAIRAAEKQEMNLPAVFNVSDGKFYSRYDLADIIKRELGIKVFKFHLPVSFVRVLARTMEVAFRFSKQAPVLNLEKLNELTAANWSCWIENIEEELHYRPRYDLESGLKRTLDWYKKNGWI